MDLHLFLSLLNWWENLLCRMKYSCNTFGQMNKAISIRNWILLGGMKDRGSTCKFRNERSVFRNLHVDQLSFIILWGRNKLNSIPIFILNKIVLVFFFFLGGGGGAMKYQFLIHNRVVFRKAAGAAVSYVKGTVSQKNAFQIISYKHVCSQTQNIPEHRKRCIIRPSWIF